MDAPKLKNSQATSPIQDSVYLWGYSRRQYSKNRLLTTCLQTNQPTFYIQSIKQKKEAVNDLF